MVCSTAGDETGFFWLGEGKDSHLAYLVPWLKWPMFTQEVLLEDVDGIEQ